MKTIITILLIALSAAAQAQPPRKIRIVLDVRGDNETTVGRLMADVRREIQSVPDVELVPPGDSPRSIRIVTSGGGGFVAASALVTERYDRETLMVLGIEDDDTANRMMALQIVNDHQLVSGSDTAEIAKRLVASLNAGILARLRK
ncbi:MAG TPA: hypothetical protein VGY57_10550 [Vicinamibacterales bacterium]|jgi:hypothetical protein|nr:hypothetical protein [Vicinamibacterales bacterium]